MMRTLALSLPAFLLACAAAAGPLALPPSPRAGLDERPGATLPLDLPVRDADGHASRLGDHFAAGRPVLLVLGYYRCPQLCGLVTHDLLEALHGTGLARSDWRIVRVSIDPTETPRDAQERLASDLAYAAFLEGAAGDRTPLPMDLLLADPSSLQALARATGFRYEPMGARDIAHPATVIVATPQGVVSRYLQGVRFDPAQLRTALVEASDGRIGGLGDRIALLCAHFAPDLGRHTTGVMTAARAVGGITLVALAFLFLRQRRRGRA